MSSHVEVYPIANLSVGDGLSVSLPHEFRHHTAGVGMTLDDWSGCLPMTRGLCFFADLIGGWDS